MIRRFVLDRHSDPSGMSGVGDVLEGVEWSDGTISTRWRGEYPSSSNWADLDTFLAVHTHHGTTGAVRWLDQSAVWKLTVDAVSGTTQTIHTSAEHALLFLRTMCEANGEITEGISDEQLLELVAVVFSWRVTLDEYEVNDDWTAP